MRVPYFRIIKAAGYYKETQNGAYISAALNIIITLTLVFKFGLIGAALGTFIAMAYHTCYFVWYLQNNILVRYPGYFVKYIMIDCLVVVFSAYLTRGFLLGSESYLAWIVLGMKVFTVVFFVSLIIHILLCKNMIASVIKQLRT